MLQLPLWEGGYDFWIAFLWNNSVCAALIIYHGLNWKSIDVWSVSHTRFVCSGGPVSFLWKQTEGSLCDHSTCSSGTQGFGKLEYFCLLMICYSHNHLNIYNFWFLSDKMLGSASWFSCVHFEIHLSGCSCSGEYFSPNEYTSLRRCQPVVQIFTDTVTKIIFTLSFKSFGIFFINAFIQ